MRRPDRARRRVLAGIVFDDVALAGIVLASGFVALLADGAPTGEALIDAAYRATLAATATAAGADSRSWTWVVTAGAATLTARNPWAGAGMVALVVSISSVVTDRRSRLLGAAVAGTSIQALLRSSPTLPFGLASVATGTAAAVVVVSALRSHPRRRRISIPDRVGLGAAVLAVLIAAMGFAAWRAQTAAQTAADRATDGLSAFRSGDDETARGHLRAAEEGFREANRWANSPLLWPVRAVPLAAQHRQAVAVATAQGGHLSATARDSIDSVDLEALTLDGAVDLDALADTTAQADGVATAIDDAARALDDVASPWLVGPVADQLDELRAEVSSAQNSADSTLDALAIAPDLLGRDRPRHYFVAFANPAESRALGGILGAAGIVTADRGRLSLDTNLSVQDLNDLLGQADVEVPDDLPTHFTATSPERFGQNWTTTPDLPSVTRFVAAVAPTLGFPPIDGVLYVDPFVIEALVELAGPVAVAGVPQRIRAEDVVEFLLRDQYAAFDDNDVRKDALGGVASDVFDRLLTERLPDPRRLTDVLGPLVEQGRLGFVAVDPRHGDALERFGLDRALGLADADDTYLVATSNTVPNKLDAYLSRNVIYEIELRAQREVVKTAVTVELANEVPSSVVLPHVVGFGLEGVPPRTNRTEVSLYTRHPLAGVLVRGEVVPSASAPALGGWRHAVVVSIPPGGTATIEFTLEGSRRLDREYVVRAVAPPDAGRQHTRLVVDAPAGLLTTESGRAGALRTTVPPVG